MRFRLLLSSSHTSLLHVCSNARVGDIEDSSVKSIMMLPHSEDSQSIISGIPQSEIAHFVRPTSWRLRDCNSRLLKGVLTSAWGWSP